MLTLKMDEATFARIPEQPLGGESNPQLTLSKEIVTSILQPQEIEFRQQIVILKVDFKAQMKPRSLPILVM